MKFCLVTETYPPHVNGVASTVSSLQNSLLGLGHHVQLVRPRFGTRDHPCNKKRLEEFLSSGPSSISFLNLPISAPASAALRMLWTERRPDLVHLATEGPLGFSALRTARQLGIPVTSDFRTNAHLYVRHHGLGFFSRFVLDYLRYFHNRTLFTTVPTEGLRSYLSSSGFCNLKILGRGIDTHAYSPCYRSDALRKAWGASKDDLVLLFVGRLIPEKNLILLASAYQAVLRRDRSVKLVVVGDGPGRSYLQTALPSAILCGNRFGADLAEHYASADLFLFPSLTDTFGNVVLEALASGLPVIAFDEGAASTYVTNLLNGRLCSDCPMDFIDAVLSLHRLYVEDMAGFRRLSKAARLSVMSAGWPSIANQFVSLAKDAIRTHPQVL